MLNRTAAITGLEPNAQKAKSAISALYRVCHLPDPMVVFERDRDAFDKGRKSLRADYPPVLSLISAIVSLAMSAAVVQIAVWLIFSGALQPFGSAERLVALFGLVFSATFAATAYWGFRVWSRHPLRIACWPSRVLSAIIMSAAKDNVEFLGNDFVGWGSIGDNMPPLNVGHSAGAVASSVAAARQACRAAVLGNGFAYVLLGEVQATAQGSKTDLELMGYLRKAGNDGCVALRSVFVENGPVRCLRLLRDVFPIVDRTVWSPCSAVWRSPEYGDNGAMFVMLDTPTGRICWLTKTDGSTAFEVPAHISSLEEASLGLFVGTSLSQETTAGVSVADNGALVNS